MGELTFNNTCLILLSIKEFINPEWYCPSKWDPILMILEIYDTIIGDLLLQKEKIIGITGFGMLNKPFMLFHINRAGVQGEFDVLPRMSRDFLIEVYSREHALSIEEHLNQFRSKKPVFLIIEVNHFLLR